LKDIISSIFSHEIKNSLASIKFGLDMFVKYDVDRQELKESSQELMKTVSETLNLLEEYLNFIKFHFIGKLRYETIDLYQFLDEIKSELLPFAEKDNINIYIQKSDVKILNNKIWLKRAIHNIVFNAIKYNRRSGTVNIKIEPSMFGVYVSVSDTGIGIDRKKLKTIFKFFERVDENSKGFGVGLALSKSVIDSIGGKINVKSNENIGSEFILYIPYKPKEITLKKIASGMMVSSFLLFLGISYFPIYSQNYTISNNGGYISYKLEDGSVLKFENNAHYKLALNKNLYNSKFSIDTDIYKGAMTLKAIKAKATINVDNMEFKNLGTDFKVIKDNKVKVAVFDGKVKGGEKVVSKKEGLIVTAEGEMKVKLLDKVKDLMIKDNILRFKDNPKAIKYQILFSQNRDFSKIENSFYTTNNNIKLSLSNDTLYFVKVFAYDENGLPSMPNVIEFINLSHYQKALKLEKIENLNEAMLELENSVSTIKNYSPLPYFEIAKLYFKNKNYIKSIFFVQKAIKIENRVEFYKLLADNYIALKKYKKLKNIIDKPLTKNPNDIKLLYYKAIILKNYDLNKAQKVLFKLLQLNPKDKKANLLMGEILDKLGKKDLANYYREMAN